MWYGTTYLYCESFIFFNDINYYLLTDYNSINNADDMMQNNSLYKSSIQVQANSKWFIIHLLTLGLGWSEGRQ